MNKSNIQLDGSTTKEKWHFLEEARVKIGNSFIDSWAKIGTSKERIGANAF